MPAGKEAEFAAGFSKFYNATKVHILTTLSQILTTYFFPTIAKNVPIDSKR